MACLNLCFTNSTYDLGMLWNGREIKVAFCLHLFIAKKKALPLEFHQQTWSQKNNNIGDFMGWVIHTQIWSLQQFSCWEAHSKASSKIEGLFQACFQWAKPVPEKNCHEHPKTLQFQRNTVVNILFGCHCSQFSCCVSASKKQQRLNHGQICDSSHPSWTNLRYWWPSDHQRLVQHIWPRKTRSWCPSCTFVYAGTKVHEIDVRIAKLLAMISN